MKTRIRTETINYPDDSQEVYYYPEYHVFLFDWGNIRLDLANDGKYTTLEDAQKAIDEFILRMRKFEDKRWMDSKKKVTNTYTEYP